VRRVSRLTIILLMTGLCLAVISPAAANPLKGVQRLFKKWGLFQGVQVSGQNSLTLQQYMIEGSDASFVGQRWDTGSLQRRTSLHLEGPVFKEVGFRADLSASGWGPSYSRWLVGYVGHETALYIGDLNINLRGNEFANFSKNLKGWQVDEKLPHDGLLRAFQSKEKGFTRNQTMAGNDTSGPYFLTYTPIIEGSERVKVDEQPQRLGLDYRIDYQTGELWFEPIDRPPKIIPSTSTISLSYMASGYFGSPGTLSGLRAEMPLMAGKMRVGLTMLKQDRPEAGSGDTVGYQEDYYQGSGSTGPFDTNFRPIVADGAQITFNGKTQTLEHPLLVLVDNVEQEEGVDYDSYREIGRIIFRRAVPPTSLVKIQYYYDLRSTTLAADTEVTGLDLNYRISDNLALRADLARSSGGSSGQSGGALSVLLSYSLPKLTASTGYRDMDATFSFMDTTGFRRQEKGLNVNLQWQPTRHIQLSNRYSSMKSGQGLSFGYSGYGGGYGFQTGGGGYYGGGSYGGGYGGGYYGMQTAQSATSTSTLDISTNKNDLDLRLDFVGWPSVNITHQTMSNSGGSLGGSKYDSTSLRLSHRFSERLNLNANLVRTKQNYAGTSSSGDDNITEARGSSTNQRLVSIEYRPTDTLSLSANLGRHGSTAHGTMGNASNSRNVQLSARWQPSDRLSINLQRTGSQSTGRVSSGFYGGFPGSGYSGYPGTGGGGWGGPIAGGGGTYPYQADDNSDEEEEEETQTRYEDSTTSLDVNYRPTRTISLNLNTRQRKYSSGGGAGYLADSNQRSRSLSLSWQASDALTVMTSLSRDHLNFLQQGRGAVSNNMLTVGLNYQPPGQPWGASINMNRMSGSSPTYIQVGSHQHSRMVSTSLFDLSGQLNYQLSDNASLYARTGLSDFTSGYSAFKRNRAEIGLGYRLNDTSDFNFGYRFEKYLAGQVDSPFSIYTGATMQSQDYVANTFMLTFQTHFTGGSATGQRFAGPTATFGGPSYGYGGYGEGALNLATSGGYQAGFGQTYGYGGRGQPGAYGPFGSGAGYQRGSQYDYQRRYAGSPERLPGQYEQGQYQGREGFEAGLGEFEQQQARRPTEAPPSLGWEAPPQAPEQRPPAAEPIRQQWPVVEGLSRWQIPEVYRLW